VRKRKKETRARNEQRGKETRNEKHKRDNINDRMKRKRNNTKAQRNNQQEQANETRKYKEDIQSKGNENREKEGKLVRVTYAFFFSFGVAPFLLRNEDHLLVSLSALSFPPFFLVLLCLIIHPCSCLPLFIISFPLFACLCAFIPSHSFSPVTFLFPHCGEESK